MGGGASKEVKLLDAAKEGNVVKARAALKKKANPDCRDKVMPPPLSVTYSHASCEASAAEKWRRDRSWRSEICS